MRKFTAIPGHGIFAGSRVANKCKILAADEQLYEYNGKMFDAQQMKRIRWGLDAGIDVDMYADPKFNSDEMHEIYYGLLTGVDASIYADPEYDWRQMWEIREGLEQGVDVSVYADPKFDDNQMEQIRKGLKSGVDVSKYADPEISANKMANIRKKLKSNEHTNNTLDYYVKLFEDADAVRRYIDEHDNDEDGIDLADADIKAVLYVRKDDSYPEDNCVEICVFNEDSVDHRVWNADGTTDRYVDYA